MKQRIQYPKALCTLFIGLAPLAAAAETIPLPALEKRLPEVLSVRAADAALESAKQALAETQANSGWRLGAAIAVADHRPLVRSEATPSYTGLDGGLKLSYPILGSRAKEQEAVINAGAEQAMSDTDYASARRQALYALRARYIAYWQAQESARLAEEFRASLAGRVKAAEAQRREGVWTAAEMLHFRDLENQAALEVEKAAGRSKEALAGMRSLLGSNLPAFTAEAPSLGGPCGQDMLLAEARRADPTLGRLTAKLDALRAEQGLTEWRHVDAAFSVGVHTTNDVGDSRHGRTAAVGLEFSLPLGAAEARRARKDRLGASVQSYSLQIAQQESELTHKLIEATANYHLAEATVKRSESQAQAAKAELARTQARFHEAPGNILSELVDDQAAAHNAAAGYTGARANLAAQSAALALLAPEACNVPEAKPVALEVPEATPVAQGAQEPEVKPLAIDLEPRPMTEEEVVRLSAKMDAK